MKFLAFSPNVEGDRIRTAKGKRVRRPRFEARSSLPVSAACVVGNGVRETLSALLGTPVTMRLCEPSIPSPDAWHLLVRNARLYRVRGTVSDAAIVLRAADATALSTALFGESHCAGEAERALSPIECDVLDRMVNAIAANLAAVCGNREGHQVERVGEIGGFVTYFELLIEEPATARIGIALSRDPSSDARGSLEVAHLARVEVTVLACAEIGSAQAAAVARLPVGAVIPMTAGAFTRCALTAHGRRLARGTCGVLNGNYAFCVDATREAM